MKNEIGTPSKDEESTGNSIVVESENSASSKIAFVVYDAWKYANDYFRRTFILTLQKTLGVKETSGMRNFYKSSSVETE